MKSNSSNVLQTREIQISDTAMPPGTVVGDRYRILHFLGAGGFASVYAAEDQLLGETVALKVFRSEIFLETRQLPRIKREIRLSRRITDPRVVKVFSLERWRNRWFMVMEMVRGETLRGKLDRVGRMDWLDFQPVFLEILTGVAALHAHRIVHRDIKPSNIMLTHDSGVKILDFGLAKEMGDWERSVSIGEVVGTPRYLSPEQLRGGSVDVRSDVFQLGLLLQTVLSGTPPLEGLDTLSILARRMGRGPVSLQLGEARVPLPVKQGLEKALRRRPDRRFANAMSMRRFFSASQGKALRKVFLKRGITTLLLGALLFGSGFLLFRRWGGGTVSGLEVDGSNVRVVTSRGGTQWERDFSPRSVYRAFMQPCIPPIEANRSNVPIHHMVNVVLVSSRDMDVRTQASLGSTQWDGQMLRFSAGGSQRSNHPLSSFIQAGSYGFIPRSYVGRFQERDLNGDGIMEVLLSLVHGRGMFPSALALFSNGRTVIISSPGHINDWTVTPGKARNWRFTLWGVANRMCHLDYVTRMELSGTAQLSINSSLIPHLNAESRGTGMYCSQLTFLPKTISLEKGDSLPHTGPLDFIFSSGGTLRVDENGTLTVGAEGRVRVYRDAREMLDAVYSDIHFGLQARDLRNDLETSARLLDRALAAGVENPFLRSAILYHRGDVAVRRGRYPEGKRWLRHARELHSENLDAAQRLCEVELLERGPRAALRMVDGEFSQIYIFWGLSCGRDFFRALCLLQAGEFASARLFSGRMEQGDLRNARLVRALIDLFSGKRIADELPVDNSEMSLLYTWEEYRLLEGRARFLEGDDSGRGEFCFQDVYEHSGIRRHLASMTRAWYALKAGRSGDAERMAKIAFRDLRTRARGELETRIWWFYDAWVYGRIMEELKEKKEARKGFSACVKANPHTNLARRANLRLSGLMDR